MTYQKARIIWPACSPWGFPVAISQMKDGLPHLCIDYRTSKKLMKADKFPIPSVEEILDGMEGATIFSKLDSFAGY